MVLGAVWTIDLQITKLADAQAIAGTTFGASLAYRNNGPAPATGVMIVDILPTGISFVSATRGGSVPGCVIAIKATADISDPDCQNTSFSRKLGQSQFFGGMTVVDSNTSGAVAQIDNTIR